MVAPTATLLPPAKPPATSATMDRKSDSMPTLPFAVAVRLLWVVVISFSETTTGMVPDTPAVPPPAPRDAVISTVTSLPSAWDTMFPAVLDRLA